MVEGGESVARLAMSLNALGASPRQLVEIFKTMKVHKVLLCTRSITEAVDALGPEGLASR